MFKNDMKERTEFEVPIGEVDGITLNSLVKYCYTGCIDIKDTNISELLTAVSMMQFSDIEQKCIEYLTQQLQSNPINCLKLNLIADRYSFRELREQTIDVACENFRIVSKTDDFMQLNYQVLREILTSDKVFAPEEDIFDAAMKWINYDESNRKILIGEILHILRLTQVDLKVS